jgi:hypothetical protein
MSRDESAPKIVGPTLFGVFSYQSKRLLWFFLDWYWVGL